MTNITPRPFRMVPLAVNKATLIHLLRDPESALETFATCRVDKSQCPHPESLAAALEASDASWIIDGKLMTSEEARGFYAAHGIKWPT